MGIFLGHGNYSFTDQMTLLTGSTPISLALGDFNQDTILDIVVANQDNDNIGIFIGCGNGSFLSQRTFTTGYKSQPKAVSVGDFNNDTLLDIIVANYGTHNVGMLLGDGNGSFANVKLFSIDYESHPFLVLVGDLNNDRKLDLVVANEGTDNVKLLLQAC